MIAEQVETADPVRFLIQVPSAPDLATWAQKARRAEASGFSALSVPDHLGASLPQLAPLIALAFAAGVTTRLRLAVSVLDNDFRHPVMLAKEIATLDLLSGGRVDMGLGAGWLEEDYTTTGVATWEPAGTRVRRLTEAVPLIRALLEGGMVHFDGEFYSVNGYECVPQPVQQPVPVMIGCREKRMVGLAAREANMVNLLPAAILGASHLEILEQQLRWIDEAGGRDRGDLQIGLRIFGGRVAAEGESGREAAVHYSAQAGMTLQDTLASPYLAVGDLDMIREHVDHLVKTYGISFFTVSEDLGWAIADLVKDYAPAEDLDNAETGA